MGIFTTAIFRRSHSEFSDNSGAREVEVQRLPGCGADLPDFRASSLARALAIASKNRLARAGAVRSRVPSQSVRVCQLKDLYDRPT